MRLAVGAVGAWDMLWPSSGVSCFAHRFPQELASNPPHDCHIRLVILQEYLEHETRTDGMLQICPERNIGLTAHTFQRCIISKHKYYSVYVKGSRGWRLLKQCVALKALCIWWLTFELSVHFKTVILNHVWLGHHIRLRIAAQRKIENMSYSHV